MYLEPNAVPAHLRGNYAGKNFQAIPQLEVSIPIDAGLWSGGSRDTYRAIRLADGMSLSIGDQQAAPWDESRRARVVKLEPGIAVVEHSIFCGKDMGLRFYVHPDDAAKLLPAPTAALTAHEMLVLEYTCSRKSSYNGKDRYQMAQDDCRYGASADKPFPSRAEWDSAKQSLIGKGLLNKAGAVTTAGKNARVRP